MKSVKSLHTMYKNIIQKWTKNTKKYWDFKVPEKLQLYGLYVYYVVHICDFGMLRVKQLQNILKSRGGG